MIAFAIWRYGREIDVIWARTKAEALELAYDRHGIDCTVHRLPEA